MVKLAPYWRAIVGVVGAVVNSAALVFSQFLNYLPDNLAATGATAISISTALLLIMRKNTALVEEVDEAIEDAVDEIRNASKGN